MSNVSGSHVYSGVAEVSIYIDPEYRGQGAGTKLMENLIDNSEKNNIWTLQAGIFPENEASVNLHTKFGFRIVGFREKIGKMDGVWRDVLLLERRSKNVAILLGVFSAIVVLIVIFKQLLQKKTVTLK